MMLTVFYGTAYYNYRGLIDEKELDQFQQHQKEENPWLSRAHVDERWQKCFKPEAGKDSLFKTGAEGKGSTPEP